MLNGNLISTGPCSPSQGLSLNWVNGRLRRHGFSLQLIVFCMVSIAFVSSSPVRCSTHAAKSPALTNVPSQSARPVAYLDPLAPLRWLAWPQLMHDQEVCISIVADLSGCDVQQAAGVHCACEQLRANAARLSGTWCQVRYLASTAVAAVTRMQQVPCPLFFALQAFALPTTTVACLTCPADTIRTVEAYADCIVLRHFQVLAQPEFACQHSRLSYMTKYKYKHWHGTCDCGHSTTF